METVIEFGKVVWGWTEVRVLAALLVLNFALALAASIRNRTFTLKKLVLWLTDQLVPYTIAYGTLKATMPMLAGFVPGLSDGLTAGVWTLMMLTASGHILSNLDELGVPLPDKVMSAIGKRVEYRNAGVAPDPLIPPVPKVKAK